MPFAPRTAVMKAMQEQLESRKFGGTRFPTGGQWWGVDPDTLTLRSNQPQISTWSPFYAPPAAGRGFAPSFSSRVQKEDIAPYSGGPGFGFLPPAHGFLPQWQPASLRSTVGSVAKSVAKSVGSAVSDTKRTLSDIGYNIRDKTSSSGFVPGMNPMFDAMRQAAADAGLSRLEVVAGKGQGHLSHAHGTEADIVGYNADGSKWSKAQRVAVAKGAATAGGNRFGFYSGPTLHVGLGYQGSPHNVVWNNQLRGQPGVNTFAPEERDFVNALRLGRLAAYTPTTSYRTPVQQAVDAQAQGRAAANPQVAQMQRDLNSLGATLTVDGIMGPQTRAAVDKIGTPITSRGDVSALQRELNAKGANLKVDGIAGPLTRAAINTYGGSVPATPQTPYLNNPYTMTTGGANTLTPRQVPTVAVQSGVRSKSPLPSYYDSQASSNMAVTGGRRVPTAAGYVPTTGPVLTGGFVPPAQQVPTARPPQTPQTPYYSNPYTMGTGGANAIVAPTARIPQPRPAYTPPAVQQAPLAARMPQPRPAYPLPQATLPGPTLMQQMQDQMRRAAAVAAQVGGQFKDAYSQGSRSGMGYSGGGGYSGGSYGGAGGRSIASGVGGAYRNR